MSPQAVITARMPQAMLDALDAYAYKHNISRVSALREAIAALTNTPNDTTHGNTRYVTDTERKLARARTNKRYYEQAKTVRSS